jgi:hypothetical protein
MKKIFQFLCLIVLFSGVYYGCRKDNSQSGVIFTPYADVINPPDSFTYYIPLSNNAIQQGKIQFSNDAVWHITKTAGISTNTWLSRADNPTIFSVAYDNTVALQGNYPYSFTASNTGLPEGTKIFIRFVKTKLDYQSFSPKY